MYQYTEFDRRFVHQRAAQYRDQLERNLAGRLGDDEFRPLRLQNGWYVQRHAPMLRIAVPYGEINAKQLRQLARIAREYDRGYGHFTTRQNLQFNWIPLDRSADVMDLLAEVDMHGIQTSGNCIRNITSDALAGVAPDEVIDPRPYIEILRQWSTLHPEFAFLPRKFKIAVTGATEDRAAIGWHDIGLQMVRNAAGETGFKVWVGGGMGRTPIIGTLVREFLPWQQILVFIEAIVRVYNRYGRRDNMYKARIKILVKAEGQKFVDAVNTEFAHILNDDVDGGAHMIPQAELDRVNASFVLPEGVGETGAPGAPPAADLPPAYRRWLQRNVHGHRLPGYRAVTLSLKRAGQAPGDVTDTQMEQAAAIADRYSHGELRVTHDQNLLLPWVRESDLPALWEELRYVFLFWISHGVTIFRVDNPHTKAFRFWEWCINEVKREHPESIFLAEAFTRPKVMRYLAKSGFTQSYTYFSWRNTAAELRDYVTALTQTAVSEYMRPNFFANTPDILHEYLQHGGRPAFAVRLILAATLSATYGIYSGFELCENTPVRPGSEEYLDSEKYQFTPRDWKQAGRLNELIARINRIRRDHPALQQNTALTFHPVDNPDLLWFSKAAGRDRVFVAANTDPRWMQHGWVEMPLAELGLAPGAVYTVEDLLTGARYTWRGARNYVRLDPSERAAHVLVVKA